MGKKSVGENKIEKSVLVLSDSELLFDIIWANLHQTHLKIHGGKPTYDSVPALQKNERIGKLKFDLIIIANSSRASEPVVVLAEAALSDQIGHTPLLIISDRNFAANQEKQIFHLDFPFEPVALRHKVQTLLEYESVLE